MTAVGFQITIPTTVELLNFNGVFADGPLMQKVSHLVQMAANVLEQFSEFF